MAYQVEASASVGWVCVQYGVPFLLLLCLNGSLQHQFAYRFWRLQIWLHRVSDRFRPANAPRASHIGGMPVDARGFDPQHHYHLGGQLPPRVRLAMAPLLAFGVVMLMVMPPMLLLAWAATLYFNQGRMLLAVAVGIMAVVMCSLYYAIQYWHSSQITRHTQHSAQRQCDSHTASSVCALCHKIQTHSYGHSPLILLSLCTARHYVRTVAVFCVQAVGA